jgi:hypothetical protein
MELFFLRQRNGLTFCVKNNFRLPNVQKKKVYDAKNSVEKSETTLLVNG